MAEKEEDAPEPGSTGMEKNEMKAALARSRNAPINCAVAAGDPKEGGLGLLLLDKTKPGKALVKELQKQYPKLRTPCFGTASVDMDTDAKQVVFNLNKNPAGLDKKVRKTLKGTGYSKVQINIGEAEPE